MSLRPFFDDQAAWITIYCGDARQVLPQLGPADHLMVDPPYSDHVHTKARSSKSTAEGEIVQAYVLGFDSLGDALRAAILAYAAQHVARWSLVFSDVESTHLWRQVAPPLEYVRTAFWRRPGAPQFTGDRPAVACECITLLHRRGRKRWNGGGKQGMYDTPIVQARSSAGTEYRCHETQKPERLMEQLIADYTDPGDLVIDPCMGSGATLLAAKRLGRRAIGIEQRADNCESAAARLSQHVLGLELGAAQPEQAVLSV